MGSASSIEIPIGQLEPCRSLANEACINGLLFIPVPGFWGSSPLNAPPPRASRIALDRQRRNALPAILRWDLGGVSCGRPRLATIRGEGNEAGQVVPQLVERNARAERQLTSLGSAACSCGGTNSPVSALPHWDQIHFPFWSFKCGNFGVSTCAPSQP
jgi:hypothetical protein